MGGYTRPALLTRAHDVADFDCGSVALSEWLRKYALAAQNAGSSRVYVTCVSGSEQVVGYYALAAGEVAHASASARMTQGLGRYPVPVIVLTRLGVDTRHQRKGLGIALVTNALRRADQASDDVGVRGVALNAESQAAKDFYLNYARFDESPTDPLHLMILMKDLRAAVRTAVDGRLDRADSKAPEQDAS